MPTCPNGHQSGSDDWCEVCGHRMAGAVPPPPPPPPTAGYGYPPPPPPPGGGRTGGRPLSAVPGADPELCPQCRTPREGGAPFCEECRWNFLTNTATSYTPAAPRPPAPNPALRFQQGGGQTASGADPFDYERSRPSQVNRPAEPIPPGSPFGDEPSGPTSFGTPPSRPSAFGEAPSHPSAFGESPSRPSAFGESPSHPSAFGADPSRPQGFGNDSGFGADPSRPVPPPPAPTSGGPGGAGGPGGSGGPQQTSAPGAPSAFHGGPPSAYQPPAPPPPQRTQQGFPPAPTQPGAPAFGGGEDDWMISPPSSSGPATGAPAGAGGPQGGGYGYPAPGSPQAPAPSYEQQPVTWTATIGPDREYFMAMMHRSGPEAAGLNLPAYSPEQQRTLTGDQITIGRRRHSTGDTPDIDLSVPPEDPGVSHQHALLVQQPDGTWAVVDQNSTNGTTVNGGEEPIQPFVPIPLRDGDRVHVGAWTTITIRQG
ncbi:FHA domain-containing protein [Streptomyces sp. NPDC047022]|uniref:FHA domain-containing protein n=1 Tax=Streptomyces sp. NPDC047022 TaxID=3155737 RepID=UPI0033CE3945